MEQNVAACHAGYFSCYYRQYDAAADAFVTSEELVFDPKMSEEMKKYQVITSDSASRLEDEANSLVEQGYKLHSFTVASVLDEQYGPKVGIPAYLVASFVGFRMMDAGDHWLSDVLFGAV